MIEFDNLRTLEGYERLTTLGRKYFESVLANPPARSVGETSLLSVSGSYATNKFPHMKEYESAGCEKPYVLMSVLDKTIIDIFPQPIDMDVIRHDKLGRRRPKPYVADYLECAERRFSIVENKTLSDLEKLTTESRDWQKSSEGKFKFLPGIEAAERFGMEFKIFCPDDYPKSYLTNLQLLNRIPNTDLIAEQPKLLDHVIAMLKKRPRTLSQLCMRFDGLTGGYLYQALLKKKVFGLIEHQQFNLDFVLFATSSEADQQYENLQSLKLPDETKFGPLHKRLLSCSKMEMDLTYQAARDYDARRLKNLRKNATDYRDDAKLAQALLEGAPRIAGFVRRIGDRGGNDQALSEDIRKCIVKHAKDYFNDNGIPKLSKLYANYKLFADEKGYYFPAAETYRKIVRAEIAQEQIAFMTGGKRAFHAAKAMTDGRNANPRLDIAGLKVHIDGVYGDTRSAPDENAVYLRPIFYPMVDDSTGKVLGRGIKIGRPSRLAVAMAHRDCYLKHGFLPACIYHDWGSELVNHFVPDMTAHFRVSYERRPAGAARFGGLIESFNAQFSAFLQSLSGGTYFDKAGRAADGSKKSRATASLSIAEIIYEADKWMFEVWNNTPIGAEEKSPNERFAESYRCFPEAVVEVVDDLLARYHTSLPIKGKKFSYTRGFRYGGTGFMSDKLRTLLSDGEKPTDARLDSMDPSIVIAMTDDGPISLHNLDEDNIQGLDIGLRMEALSKLMLYGRSAKANQFQRNVKEAKLLRDSAKVRDAMPIPPKATPVVTKEHNKSFVPDFKTVVGKSQKRLERLKS